MRVVAVIQEKGGEGKSTLTMNLADALQRSGSRVLVVDVDPQGSSSWWYEHGPELAFDLAADTDVSNLSRLRDVDYDVIVIDTPGSLANVAVLGAVLDVADFALLPSKNAALALRPLTRTLNEHVIPRGVPYRVLANKVDPRNLDAEKQYRGASELYELLDAAGYDHFKAFLREYKIYEDAPAEGRTILDYPSTHSRAATKAQDDLRAITAELLTIWANEPAKARA